MQKSQGDEIEAYLQRWEKVADAEALKVVEKLSTSGPLKGDGVCIETMNTELSEVRDYIKEMGFILENGDEVFAISNIVKPLYTHVQLRKEDGEWTVIKRHEMR